MRGFKRKSSIDAEMRALLEQSGQNIEQTASLLRDIVSSFPERPELFDEIRRCEHEGDRITHDIIRQLNISAAGPPLDVADGHALASTLDDIVDFAEQAADMLAIYQVQAPMEQAGAMCDVLVATTEQVAAALTRLANGDGPLQPLLVEIHRLENEGDRISRDAIASLFAHGIDPMVVIRWKDIFEALESSVDACEKVAHVLEGIELKRGRSVR